MKLENYETKNMNIIIMISSEIIIIMKLENYGTKNMNIIIIFEEKNCDLYN